MPRPIEIPVSEGMLRTAQRLGRAACIGGRSSVRDAEDRMDALEQDQIVGQLGQMALSLWKDGHLGEYLIQRAVANADPLRGDGGSDLVGSNVDVKASLMRSSDDPLSYRLPVRPAELHEGWVYVLALVDPMMTRVWLVGWATSEDLEGVRPAIDGPFLGARCIPAVRLRPAPSDRLVEAVGSMIYASLCDGIGAVHCAWRPLGWRCAWTSEIEKFPIAVVEQRHPGIPNLGDMTAITKEMIDERGPIDVLVGGTPCQSFSVAGLRGGLDDARGNLALRFMQLCAAARPRWVVWENVPGVLSVDGGRAFGSILGAMEELGHGWAYRTLDAQWFGVAQRRRRVFVVGHLGDWRRAAALLFERESVRGDPPTRESARQVAASGAGRGAAGASWWDGGQLSQTLDAVTSKGQTMPERNRFPAVLEPACFSHSAEGKTWTNEGTNFRLRNCVQQTMAVRRLTPRECERLQGFESDYTLVEHRGRPAADGPRYRAIGNSMAVPVMRWIGERIAMVDAIP